MGSTLIAQKFERAEYFHPRPSGVDYNAASTGGTNYGPSNPDHLKAVRERLDAITSREGVPPSKVPSEMVTASSGGLDPHIPPQPSSLKSAESRVRAEGTNRACAHDSFRKLDPRVQFKNPVMFRMIALVEGA